MSEGLTLSDEDLAFFRLTCDIFPVPESPLRYLQDKGIEPADPSINFAELLERDLLNATFSGASEDVRERIERVSECRARLVLRAGGDTGKIVGTHYILDNCGVEYSRTVNQHNFGPLCTEDSLVVELASKFPTQDKARTLALRMSAGDYLVFAVFAGDVRTKPAVKTASEKSASSEKKSSPTATTKDDEEPMSIDEVLAFFDEPETKYVRTPSDDSWQQSVDALCEQGVLRKVNGGFELEEVFHPLACEVIADHQQTICRFDFLDEQWLVREVNLYPTADSVYRQGTEPDGSVVIQELSSDDLKKALSGVVSTLPNILDSEMPPMLKGSVIQAQGRF